MIMKKTFINILTGTIILTCSNSVYAEIKTVIPPFEVISVKQEYKNLGNIISENISDAINETSVGFMIENNQSMKMMNNLNFKPNNLSDDKNAVKLGKYFSSNYIVPGSIEINNNKYLLEAKIINPSNTKINKTIKVESNNIYDLQIKAVNELLSFQKIKLNENQKNRINKYLSSTKNIKALNYFIDGVTQLEKHSYNSYENASALFNKALNEDKNFQLANIFKAKSLIMRSLLDSQLKQNNISLVSQAENTLNQALTASNYKDYKDIYKIKSLISFFKDNISESKNNIKKALSINSYDPEAMYISWVINGQKSNDRSIDSAIKQNPFLSLLHSDLGNYYREHSDLEQALNSYNESLKLSNNTQAQYGLANIYLSTARLNESIYQYNEILNENKGLWSVYSGLGQAYRYKDIISESKNMFLKSAELNPNEWKTHFDLGVIYTEEGELDKAIEEYSKSIKINPSNYQTHYYLGTVYKLNDDIENSISSFKESIKLKPDFAEAYYNLGVSYKKSGKIDEALNSYKQSIKLNPKYPEAFLNLGNIYIDKNDFNEAINNIKQAIKLNPKYSRAYNSLGAVYQKKGNINEAINSYKESIKIDPKSGTAYYNLSVIYRNQNKIKEAVAELKKACDQGYAPACIERKELK